MARGDTTSVVPLGRQHAEFHAGFLWVALAAAIFGGFAIGGHLSFVIGFGYPLGASFPAFVQAHGHAQLIGWAGLFVMGVSLHFIPRLASVPLPHQRWVGAIPWLMGIGLLLRTSGQPVLPYLGGGPAFTALLRLVAGSGVLEGAGILLYLLFLVHTLRGAGDIAEQPAFAAVRPYFGMMVAGWIRSLEGAGAILKGGVILWFTWQLDILTRRRPVERPARFLFSGPDRAPTRPGLPDYGEFGRFELLIYSAFAWLVLAAGCEMINGAAAMAAYSPPVALSVIRHMYLLGFITLLILGVSVRMLPGFLKKKAVASPSLVEPTIWLGNAAAVFRVLPLLLPSGALARFPGAVSFTRVAFGLSGMIGLAAVACLAVNLWLTARPSV